MKVKKIKKGSAVGIITPAAAIDKNSSRFKLLEERLNNLGLKVKYGKAVGKRYGYLGGTDEDRIEDLEAMFLDSEVSVIIAMLGGYGSSRIVDKVNYEIIKNNPKLLIGFSDITVFINAIYQKTNLPTIHGPVGIYLGKAEFDSISQADFEALLFTSQQGRILKNPKDNAKTLVSGKAKGKLVGGN
ncbi:MAG TPA: LD-carboxypeptidase, partial [Acholeplasmataceae bacterium]|nr:LD-carboxypeptidase [Acholeplasmataceae bacterium]